MTVFDTFVSDLSEFTKKNDAMFLKFEHSDFRKEYKEEIALLGKGDAKFKIPQEQFQTFVGIITQQIFQDKILLTWDIKKLFSYLYFRLNRTYLMDISSKIVDIKYGEAFLGIEGECPTTFDEAKKRSKVIAGDCWKIHQQIHIPLATKVIPKMETYEFKTIGKVKNYSFYEIEGQNHGRLRCYHGFAGSTLVHNLRKEDKVRFKPALDNKFAIIDFKAMEVYVLQWLSKDERLGKIISSKRDIYSTIYSLLYGKSCTESNRQMIKDSFLPIMYGMQPDAISKRLIIKREEADEMYSNICKFFSTAIGWIEQQQEKIKESSVVRDYFGRPRSYTEKFWVVRNAVIQGAAAIVCMEKLIGLYDLIHKQCELVASIHDAYVLDVPNNKLYDILFKAVEYLESPSVLAEGLSLKVEINVGDDLENIKKFIL